MQSHKTEIWLLRCHLVDSFSKCNFQSILLKFLPRNAILSPLNLQIKFSSILFFSRSLRFVAGCCWLWHIDVIAEIVWESKTSSICCRRPTHMSTINNALQVYYFAIFILKIFFFFFCCRCQNRNALYYKPSHLPWLKWQNAFIPLMEKWKWHWHKTFWHTSQGIALHFVRNQPHLSSHFNRNRRKWKIKSEHE